MALVAPNVCPGLCAALLLGPSEGSASVILEYRCTPDIKHECTAAGCETMSSDSGFQQAESFVYSPETGQLSACLWTNCYAGSATVFAGTATDTFTAVHGCWAAVACSSWKRTRHRYADDQNSPQG